MSDRMIPIAPPYDEEATRSTVPATLPQFGPMAPTIPAPPPLDESELDIEEVPPTLPSAPPPK